MCGLIGHIGNDKNKTNIDKLNILGILNETRGVDSCGVTMEGEIIKGIDTTKRYRDFVACYSISPPKLSNGIIGHTRKATTGSHTRENAHPFGFGSTKIKGKTSSIFKFVGVHNGTLYNHVTLAEKRGISLNKTITVEKIEKIKGEETITQTEEEVTKIDSELLLECLYKDKNFSVLEEYNGAAALIWQWLDKPDTMFFYHGKSRKDNHSDELEEERPLYYWKENANSLYVSSLLDSLYIIGGEDDSIDEFEHNVVYEVKNGNIARAKKTKIDRSNNFKVREWTSTHYGHMGGGSRRGDACQFPLETSVVSQKRNQRMSGFSTEHFVPTKAIAAQYQLNLERPIDRGLLAETFDFNPDNNKGLTMCKQLRYWRNGHLANGVFVYVPSVGFYHLGFTQREAVLALNELGGVPFYEKQFNPRLIGKTLPKGATIPFQKKHLEEDILSYLAYIHNGIRYQSYIDWKSVADDSVKNVPVFDVIRLSMCSVHPIIDLDTGAGRTHGVYFEGELAEGKFAFLGSRKMYTFRAGQVKDISYIRGMEPTDLEATDEKLYTLESAAKYLEGQIKSNGYINLKEKELLRELCSLDTIITNLKSKGNNKIKIADGDIEKQINAILVSCYAEDVVDCEKALEQLSPYKKESTKAMLASNILKELSSIYDKQ